MTIEARTKLGRIWRPEGIPGQGPLAVYYRSTLIIGAASALLVLAVPILAFGEILLHWPFWMVAGLITTGVVINLAAQGFRVWFMFRSGGWTARDGKTVTAARQPLRFWRAAIIQLIVLAIWLVAGMVVLLVLFSSWSVHVISQAE